MPMHIHLLMNKHSKLQVFHLVTNSLLSYETLWSKRTSHFFTEQLSTFFKTLIEQGFALVYIDDSFLLPISKEYMSQIIVQLHIITTKNNLKLAPEKSFLMHLRVKFLGHETGYNTIKLIQ